MKVMQKQKGGGAALRQQVGSPSGRHKDNETRSEGELSMAQTPTLSFLSADSMSNTTSTEGSSVGHDEHHTDSGNFTPESLGQVNEEPEAALSPTSPSKKSGKKINGYHTVVDKMGTKISGMWQNSQLHGKAVMHYTNGASFAGECKNGFMDGYGEWRSKNGESYKGLWKNGYTHGRGLFSWADSSTYDGDWHWGSMWGNGRFTAADGTVYVGQFVEGRRHGFARLRFPSGDQQWTIWSKDKKWITYCYAYANGDIYKRNGTTKFNMSDTRAPPASPADPAAAPGAPGSGGGTGEASFMLEDAPEMPQEIHEAQPQKAAEPPKPVRAAVLL